MPLTKEELLKPRYKVINSWPDNTKHKVGDIINAGNAKTVIEYCEFLNTYAHLFQPLKWYEERSIEDLPDYVKYWDNSYYFPVDRVAKCTLNSFKGDGFDSSNFEPATKEEYDNYLKSKQ